MDGRVRNVPYTTYVNGNQFFFPFLPPPHSPECKRPIKQLELKIGLLAENDRGSLCLVKCNQSGDKGTISAV